MCCQSRVVRLLSIIQGTKFWSAPLEVASEVGQRLWWLLPVPARYGAAQNTSVADPDWFVASTAASLFLERKYTPTHQMQNNKLRYSLQTKIGSIFGTRLFSNEPTWGIHRQKSVHGKFQIDPQGHTPMMFLDEAALRVTVNPYCNAGFPNSFSLKIYLRSHAWTLKDEWLMLEIFCKTKETRTNTYMFSQFTVGNVTSMLSSWSFCMRGMTYSFRQSCTLYVW